jgi:citrate synthase
LIIYEKLPSRAELRRFSDLLTLHELIHEDMKFHFKGFPLNAHPMAILSSMINAAGCYYPDLFAPQETQNFDESTAFILSQVRAIAAFAYRKSRGLPFI